MVADRETRLKLVIFIGHHKVGSTALQIFLARNHLALLRAGILYPSVESQGMAYNLAHAAGVGRDDGDLPINLREPHNALAFRMLSEVTRRKVPRYHENLPHSRQMFAAIHNQIAVFRPKAVILCAEVFSNFGTLAPGLIDRLRREFSGTDVTIICTLRRVDDHLAAWQGQRLCFGRTPRPLSGAGLAPCFNTIHFDFRRMLHPWLERFPDARFDISDYASTLAVGGAVPDFIMRSGLDFPAGLVAAGRANIGIPRALHEVARLGNRFLAPRMARMLREFMIGLADDPALPENDQIELFGAHNRMLLVERFAGINTYLRALAGGRAFFADEDDIARLRSISGIDALGVALPVLRARMQQHRLAPEVVDFVTRLDFRQAG